MKIYGNKHRDTFWFQHGTLPLYRVFYKIHKTNLWLKYRLVKRHRYHLVDTKLEPSYYDVDCLMLNACFALLCRYVEDECGGVDTLQKFSDELREKPDPNGPLDVQIDQAARQDDASSLYHWWMVTRPANHKMEDDLCHHLYGNRKLESKPVEGTTLVELLPTKFEGDDQTLHKKFRALQKQNEEDDQIMLHKLIDIRGSLWT